MAAAALASYFLADTVSLMTDSLVPDPPDGARRSVRSPFRREASQPDRVRRGRRPRHLQLDAHDPDGFGGGDGIARKTNLPLVLIGTVVLKNELKSIATIDDRSQNMVFPVRIADVVNNQIEIKKIEHFLGVTFVNMSTGSLRVRRDRRRPAHDESADHPRRARRSPPTASRSPTRPYVAVDAFVIRDGMEQPQPGAAGRARDP